MSTATIKHHKTETSRVRELVITAFFAAITFLGIQAFRIPLPASIGTPFVHFGHVFVVMGLLLQGGKRGAVSGTLGLVIFDILNGYIQDIPQVFAETIIKCLIVGAIFAILKEKADHDKKKEYMAAVISAVIYGCMNILIELVMGTVRLLILGSGLSAAIAGSIMSIPATVINAVFMIAAIIILYQPVRKVYGRLAY
ncbi:MAG: ECF transporter S component [Eubacteriales bacterium]|nr:ECF transporter S component [Eubacteriales bacterium]